MKTLLLVIMFLSFASVAVSQKLTDTLQIREVTILGKRRVEEAGLKITRPDSMAFARTLTSDLGGMISAFTPVFIKSYGRGSEATASFRGTSPNHTQILWNGMNLNSPMRGYADLSQLPVFFTDHVFLLHGGSSLAEGSGALGGSIHLSTLPDWSHRFYLSALYEKGSFGFNKTLMKFALGNRKFQSASRFFYEKADNDFPFFNIGILPYSSDTLKNSSFKKQGFIQELYFRPNEGTLLGLRLWYQQSHRNLPQLMSYQGSHRIEYQNDRQLRIQADWRKYLTNSDLQFFTGLSNAILDYLRETPEFGFVNEEARSREFSFLNRFRLNKNFGTKLHATISIDANYHQVNSESRINPVRYENDRFESALMARLHLRSSVRYATFFLIRSEFYDGKYIPFIPALGAEWQIFGNFPAVLHWNLSRNYHKPNLNDLYWLPGGNPGLKAEDGFSGDLTLRYQPDFKKVQLKSELTGFLTRIENWILWQPSANGSFYWEAVNIKDVFSRGIECQSSLSFPIKKVTSIVQANYAYTRTTNLNAVREADQSRGKQLIYVPKHTANVHVSAGWRTYSVDYSFSYTGKRYTRSNNEESDFEQVLNPYFLSTVGINKRFGTEKLKTHLKFRIENLLNTGYQAILWRPMPGRSYSFTLGINYNK